MLGAASLFRGSLWGMAVAFAATLPAQRFTRNLITDPVNENRRMPLHGNVRPEMTPDNDRGARDRGLALGGVLVLHRSPESEADFESYLGQLNDPGSPNFHKWLTNAEIGTAYGPSADDLAKVSAWLAGKGLSVGAASPDGTTMEFSGTVGQVSEAFHTSIRNLSVRGETHYANLSDPELPAALLPVVSGVASLNDFDPHPMNHRVAPSMQANTASPEGIRPSAATI